jgi:Flp pilus assembly secretin CpaC
MNSVRTILAACLLAATACLPAYAGNDVPIEPPAISCGNGVPGGINCVATKSDVKKAHIAYSRGLKLEEHRRFDEAFLAFDEASRLVPGDQHFFAAREVAKSQLVYQHTARGDALLADAQREPAAAEFRAALQLDPDNDYMQSRLAEAVRPLATASASGIPSLEGYSGEIHLQPKTEHASFHYRGDVRGLFTEVARSYGIVAQFDDSVQAKTVRFFVDDIDFFTALTLACRVSKTMWTPLDSTQLLVAADNPENHKQLDRMSLAYFSVPGASTPQESAELVTSLRNICEFQKISSGQNGTIEVRAPQAMLAACTKLLQQLDSERPQVSLDLKIYQISHNFTRDIGLHIPDTFNMYNIPVAALAALGGQNISSLVNQLVSSGGVNAAGSSAISGLLAQLQNQSSGIFSQPLATFGNGLTFSGVSLDHFTAALSLNESWSRSLSNATLRAGQGKEATFHLGERYPILNASYAPIYNSPQISQVLGNQSYVAPFPSVSYEDLGLNIKITAVIHGDNDVSLKLEMQVRALTGSSANGVPVISNQEYQGSIRLRDGEPAVVAGEITTNDSYAMAGIPGVASIPGLNQALLDNNKMKENDELLIILTPHVLANRDRSSNEIWVSEK